MPNEIPSLSQLSLNVAQGIREDEDMSVRIAKTTIYNTKILPKPLHELALGTLKNAYQTLVVQPYERQLNQQQMGYRGYSEEDLASERITKLAFKELEGFKSLYWLARASDLQDIVSFIEIEKKDCKMLFLTETRNNVVSKLAELGDQENIDKMLNLDNDSLEDRRSMLRSVMDGAFKGGQTAILNNLFEEKCQTEEDNTYCQNYLTDEISNLGNACASGRLDTVEFILERIPQTEQKRMISEVDQGFRYYALTEACRSGNSDVVNRLLKPFSQEEIDSIFLPSYEETNNIPLPFPYANVLSYSSVELNQYILTKVVSAECREKIVISEIFVQSLAQTYGNQDEKRSSSLLSQVPKQQFKLVRQAITLELNKQGQEDVKQRFEKDCERLKSYPSVSTSRLAGRSHIFSEAYSSNI